MKQRWPYSICWALGCAGLFVSTAAFAQRLGGGGNESVSVVRTVLALLFSLAIAFGVALFLKRRATGTRGPLSWTAIKSAVVTQSRLHVLETRRLSPHADICLARFDGTEYLLVCSVAGVSVLHSSMSPSDDAQSDCQRERDDA